MTRILAIASQKCGVGKTTTAVHLGAYLALAGQRTLLIDLDPQGNATSGLSVEPPVADPLGELWTGSADWSSLARPAPEVDRLQVLTSPSRARESFESFTLRSSRVTELRAQLLAGDWDFVVIDSPPTLGPLTSLALAWADGVIIPVQCEYFAMEGLTQMLETIGRANAGRAIPLEVTGILLTLFSESFELSVEVVEEVRKYFPDKALQTIIPRDIALAEAASHGTAASGYAPRSRGAWAYLNLAKEILAHDHA
jgi:chromosome partitioning protein